MALQDHKTYASTADLIRAERPDAPSFLFSERLLRQAADTFKRGIDGLVTYAVKANPSDHIVTTLIDEALPAFDVASQNEMALVRQFAPNVDLHYNNPIKSRREIEAAHTEYRVKSFAIDNIAQLHQIAAIVPPTKDVEITVRFKAGKARKAYDFGTKFGVMEAGAIEIVQQVEAMGYSASLCFHVGSQCEDMDAYDRHIAAAGRIAQKSGMTLKRLNLGGGFPAAYPSSGAPPMEQYFETIRRGLIKTFSTSAPQIIVEPGRALVTPCTSLLLRVKHQRDGRSVYLNDGAYGALMEVKFMPIIPPVRVWRGNQVLEGETGQFTIFGPTCDSYDVLPQLFDLPKSIEEDDWIEFGLMGAYTQASVTNFNGFSDRPQFYVDDILI